MNLDPIITVH